MDINLLNIGLMVVSCVMAFVLPFELFLFSYILLGPLHYLTEIVWLHQRDYFSTSKYDVFWLGLLCSLLLVFRYIFPDIQNGTTICLFIAFISAFGFAVFERYLYKILLLLAGVLTGLLMQKTHFFTVVFGIFLPTLIHVFLFTGLFILFGSLKSKSKTGYASSIVFFICAISFFVFTPQLASFPFSDFAQKSYAKSGFAPLNQALLNFINSENGIAVMRLIAFAYTYHYLNWFSKTSVIKWHLMPKKWLYSVLVLWLLSVGFYLQDFKIRLVVLYFLSMLHVILEFPLNYKTMMGIGKELRKA